MLNRKKRASRPELEAIHSEMQAAIRQKLEGTREIGAFIGRMLRELPLRRVVEDGVEKLRVPFSPESEEHLRDFCEDVACVDGHALDDDALLATLALVALRGTDELRLLALNELEEERRTGKHLPAPPPRPRTRHPRKRRRR